MSTKSVILTPKVTTFLSAEAKANLEAPESQEEIKNALEFFSAETVESNILLTLKLEDFLWKLFESIEVPKSPLRLKAHERFLQEVAGKLKSTIDTEAIPTLSVKELECIVKHVDDPEEFAKLTLPFEFKKGEESKYIPLPSTNMLFDSEFLGTLDEVFSAIAE